MRTFLRFVGVANIGVWFGVNVFMIAAAGPAFFSPEMSSILPASYASRVLEVLVHRCLVLQVACGVIALVHLFLEHLISGHRAGKLAPLIVAGLLAIAAGGLYWLQPRMHDLQAIRYSARSTPAQKAEATLAYDKLWRVSKVMLGLAVLGTLAHFWRLSRPLDTPKFMAWEKVRN